MVVYDGIHTTNHFYGGQVGGRLSWQQDRLSVNLTAKVALGGDGQVTVGDTGEVESRIQDSQPRSQYTSIFCPRIFFGCEGWESLSRFDTRYLF